MNGIVTGGMAYVTTAYAIAILSVLVLTLWSVRTMMKARKDLEALEAETSDVESKV